MAWPDILLMLVVLVTSYLATPPASSIATRARLVDVPGGALKRHTEPTPRAGGIALAFPLTLAIAVSYLMNKPFLSVLEAVGALVVFALGLWDDRTPRSAGVRLALQIGVFVFLYFAGLRVETALPDVVDFAFGLACFVVVINGVNFYDGMDGLLPLTAILALAVWGSVSLMLGLNGWLFVISAAALLGFLPRNWDPAQVFLGDAGSMLVGYVFFLAIQRASMTDFGLSLGLWVAAVPVCDAGAATIHRLLQRRSVFSGDRDHIYDILFRLGWSQGKISIALGMVAGICAAGGLVFRSGIDAWLAVVALYLLLTTAVLYMRLKYHETGRKI